MSSPTGARLRVEADLAVEIDGVPAHISGDGDVVQVMTQRPVALVRSLSRTSLPRVVEDSLPAWRDQLAASGLRVEVRSPRGLLATFGEDARRTSRGPRLATRHIQPGSSRVLAREVAQEAALALPRQRGLVLALVVLVPVAVGIVRRVLRGRS